MSKKISIGIFLLFALSVFVFSNALGQEMEYKEYTVIKGDTLWDISAKEIQDPFLWPKVWKENPEIKNPDRIRPNQVIRIPLRLLQAEQAEPARIEKEVSEPTIKEMVKKEEPQKPAAKKIAPSQLRYIADKDLIAASGYITDYIAPAIKSVGEITGSPSGRTLLGREDYIYINTATPANPGDKFYVVRSVHFVKHPRTGVKLGYLITVPGIVEVIGEEDGKTKCKIIKSFSDAHKGDLLDAYYEVEPVMEDDSPRKPDINGFIVAVHQVRSISGFMDVIFLDKGSDDGLEVGDALQTISVDKNLKSRAEGVIQIISLKNSTAAALIRKSEDAIKVGDTIRGLK